MLTQKHETDGKPTLLSKLDARIPNWDVNKLEARACPFCYSAGKAEYVRPDQLEVHRCFDCGAFFVSPAPNEDVLNRFYVNYFSCHMDPISRYDTNILLSDPLADPRVVQVMSLLNPRGKQLLDIGFGKGDALVRFKKLGANVEGIEVDEGAIAFVKKKLGIQNVRKVSLDELNPSKSYDIILMHDLIEHPLNPSGMLTKANDLLNDGGLLSIWTPNASFVHAEREPYLFRVDLEHMQFLTFRTCAYLSQKLDLQLVHLESTGFPLIERINRLSNLDREAELREASKEATRVDLMRSSIKTFVRRLPGYPSIKYYNQARIARNQKNPRLGNYFLFCILQKGGI